MTSKTVFIANDGKEFLNEVECLNYENNSTDCPHIIKNEILFFNSDGEQFKIDNLSSLFKAIEDFEIIYIGSEEALDKLYEYATGYFLPDSTGLYYVDTQDEYVPLNAQALQSVFRVLLNRV